MTLQSTVRNAILASLPPSDFAHVAKNLMHVHLVPGQSVYQVGDPILRVFFVESGLISGLEVLSSGQALEMILIGPEGVAGISTILGATHSLHELVSQVETVADSIPTAVLKEAVAHRPHLRDLLLRYVHFLGLHVSQTGACNVHHDVVQRLSRWLLSADNRSGGGPLTLTHDSLSVLLGVRRATVTLAASRLREVGVISYQHGRITITDRVGLKNAACECYNALATHYRAIFGDGHLADARRGAAPPPAGHEAPPANA